MGYESKSEPLSVCVRVSELVVGAEQQGLFVVPAGAEVTVAA